MARLGIHRQHARALGVGNMDAFKLTPDEQKQLRDADSSIAVLRDTIKKARLIGLPFDELDERLETYIQRRNGMLREFGNPTMPR